MSAPASEAVGVASAGQIVYKQYKDEHGLETVMSLIDNELSEPYSIFTYRYFLRNWPNLCFMATDAAGRCFGCVVAKMDVHRERSLRGYIAMLVVEKEYRHLGVGSELVRRVIEEMVAGGCEEVALEAEVTNPGALRLYEKLGFIRDKRLQRYYLNGNDAYRLKLLLPGSPAPAGEVGAVQALQALEISAGGPEQPPLAAA